MKKPLLLLLLLLSAFLMSACETPLTISSKPVAPPVIPPPPAAIYEVALPPSGHYSKKLTDWREKAQRRLTEPETASPSAVTTPK